MSGVAWHLTVINPFEVPSHLEFKVRVLFGVNDLANFKNIIHVVDL